VVFYYSININIHVGSLVLYQVSLNSADVLPIINIMCHCPIIFIVNINKRYNVPLSL